MIPHYEWEYRAEEFMIPFIQRETLARIGKEGWEMVGVASFANGALLFFKRLKGISRND